MQQFTVGYAGLDAVPQGMAEVEEGAHAAGFLLVFFNDAGFDGDIVGDDGGQALDGVEGEAKVDFLGQLAQGAKHGRLADGSVLDHFSHSFAQNSRGEREQGGRVGYHEGRLVESADEVLAGGNVNGCLAAYRAVNLSHDGGGYLDEGYATVVDGGNKSGQISYYAAAQRYYKAAAVVTLRNHFVDNLLDRTQIFVLFPGLENMKGGAVAGIFEAVNDFFSVQGVDVAVADNGGFAVQAQATGEVPHAVQRIVFNMDVIGACTERKVDYWHAQIIRTRPCTRKALLCTSLFEWRKS